MNKKGFIFLFILCLYPFSIYSGVTPKWISVGGGEVNKPNMWIAFRKNISFPGKPEYALTQIAVDSKYWLWINDELVIFEGGLKRDPNPNPNDTYYDEIDLAPYFIKGINRIAILVWYFGKDGFSHKDSGKAGLLFSLESGDIQLVSDESWNASIHPAYGNTGDPSPNWRLPESNILFDTGKDIPGWKTNDCSSTYGLRPAVVIGDGGDHPWNKLHKRSITFWKIYPIEEAEVLWENIENEQAIYTARLPYNMQMTPIISFYDSIGNNKIHIETDHTFAGGDINLRAEYISCKGWNRYELAANL